MAKKKKCFVCGKDLTHRSFMQVLDDETRKVVIVCSSSCFNTIHQKGNKKPGAVFIQHKASK